MRKFTRTISILLSICLILTIFAAAPVSVSAFTYTLWGDVDGDGEISILDADAIMLRLADIIEDAGFNQALSDVDQDGVLTIMDETCIRRYLAGFTGCGLVGQDYYGLTLPEPVQDELPIAEQTYPSSVVLEDWDGTETIKTVSVGDEFTVYTSLNLPDNMKLSCIDIHESLWTLNSPSAYNQVLSMTNYPGSEASELFPVLGESACYNMVENITAGGIFAYNTMRMNYTGIDGTAFPRGSLLMKTTFKVMCEGNAKIKIEVDKLGTVQNGERTVQINHNSKTGTNEVVLHASFDKPTDPPTAHPTEAPINPNEEPTESPTEAPATECYYIVGTITNWQIDSDYMLTENTAADTTELMLTELVLSANDQIKVVKYTPGEDLIWFPDGMDKNYKITADGNYDIYFRPNYDGGEGWFNTCIFVTSDNTEPTEPIEAPTVPPTEVPTESSSEAPTQAPTPPPTEATTGSSSESPDECEHHYVLTVTPPSCTERGYSEYRCSKCGDTYTDDYVDAAGHTKGEWEVIQEATKTEAGIRVKKCTICGEELEREYIPKTGRQPTLVGGITTREVEDPEEIKSLGIDTADPENNVIFECKADLTYRAVGEDHPNPEPSSNRTINFYTNSAGRVVSTGGAVGYVRLFPPTSSGGTGGTSASGYTGGSAWYQAEDSNIAIQPLGSNGDEENPTYYYLCLEGYGSILKQIFNVSLLVQNESGELWYEDTKATINLPDGLSLAAMSDDAHNVETKLFNIDNPAVEDGFIDKSGTGAATWYVRGDNAGLYDITVNVAGKIYPEPYDEFDDVFFKTEEPIKIEDISDCLKLSITNVPEVIKHGQTANITLTMTNISDRILNGITLKLKDGEKQTYDYLAPEQSVSVMKAVTFDFASMDADEITYYLEQMIYLCDDNFPLEVKFAEVSDGDFTYTLSAYEDSAFTHEVKDLTVTYGSFSWDKAAPIDLTDPQTTGYDKLYLKLTVGMKSNGEFTPSEATGVSVEIKAPDGFSFSPIMVSDTKTILIDRITKSEKYVYPSDIILYPVYLADFNNMLTANVKISAENFEPTSGLTSLFNVAKNKDESTVLLRNSFATSGKEVLKYNLEMDLSGLENKSLKYNSDLAKLSAAFSAATYQINSMESTFRNLGFSDIKLCNYNFDNDQISANIDQVACAFATKRIVIKDKNGGKDNIYTVLAVAIRGTLEREWHSNFDVGFGDIHYGFESAYTYVSTELAKYYADLKKITEIFPDHTKVFISGHSRAGAVADLLATELNSETEDTGLVFHSKSIYANPDDIFTYTFAAATSTKKPIRFNNIFNIICETDLVPHVPGQYQRSGVDVSVGDITLPKGLEHADRMFVTFTKMFKAKDKKINFSMPKPYLVMLYDLFSHCPTRAASWETRNIILILDSASDTASIYKTLQKISSDHGWITSDFVEKLKQISSKAEEIASWLKEHTQGKPEDYTIGDLITDNVIFTDDPDEYVTKEPPLTIYSNHAMESYIAWLYSAYDITQKPRIRHLEIHCPVDVELIDSSGKSMCKIENNEVLYEDGCIGYIDGESKCFIVDDNDYTFLITGYDDGEMSVELFEYDEDNAVSRYINYDDVTVTKSKTATLSVGEIPEDAAAAYILTQYDDTTLSPARDETGDQIEYVTISAETVNSGYVVGAGDYIKGQQVTMTAIEMNSQFDGWFLDGKLVSSEKTFYFICDKNISLEARFTDNKPLILGDVDADGTVTIIDATYIQKRLASIPIPFEINEAIADTDEDGSVTILDATYIQRWLASFKSNDNIGKPVS